MGYRRSRGLTQRDLASLLAWDRSQVAHLERANHDPRFSTLEQLAERLGLEVDIVIREGRVTDSREARHARASREVERGAHSRPAGPPVELTSFVGRRQ